MPGKSDKEEIVNGRIVLRLVTVVSNMDWTIPLAMTTRKEGRLFDSPLTSFRSNRLETHV